MVDGQQHHRLGLAQRPKTGHEDPAIQRRAHDALILIGREVADHLPHDAGLQLTLAPRPVLVGVGRAEVKREDPRSLEIPALLAVLNTKGADRGIAQAPIETTIALLVALSGELQPAAVDRQQRLLQGVFDADAPTAAFGLLAKNAAQVRLEPVGVHADELLVGVLARKGSRCCHQMPSEQTQRVVRRVVRSTTYLPVVVPNH